MQPAAALLLATLVALAGCAVHRPGSVDDGTPTGGTGTTTTPTTGCADCLPPGDMTVSGIVESDSFAPLAGANVSMPELGLRATTDGQGRFHFPGVAPSVYSVEATASGFAPAMQVARPEVTSLTFILYRAAPPAPYNVTMPFHGFLECASESLILSGPCDLVVQFAGGPPVFQNESAFDFRTDLAWKTIVLDLDFQPSDSPGIDGLRETLRGQNDTAALGTYAQYGRFHDSVPFSVRIDPGGNYTDGDAPVPANVTAFKLEVYPQGRGYHEVCDPDGTTCFLGVGAAVNLRFDLFVTIFYVEPAPAGFTLLQG